MKIIEWIKSNKIAVIIGAMALSLILVFTILNSILIPLSKYVSGSATLRVVPTLSSSQSVSFISDKYIHSVELEPKLINEYPNVELKIISDVGVVLFTDRIQLNEMILKRSIFI